MRWILIAVPTILIVFLLQSYIWVPTYEEQTRGNPERLTEYIEASGGDAHILNPILSADSVSSTIEAKVFDGLIDRDEDLNFRGRLATHWEIFEEAYFYVNDRATIPDIGKADAEGVIRFLRDAIKARKGGNDPVSRSLANIEKVEVLPARTFEVPKQEKGAGGKAVAVTIRVSAPPGSGWSSRGWIKNFSIISRNSWEGNIFPPLMVRDSSRSIPRHFPENGNPMGKNSSRPQNIIPLLSFI